MAKSVRARRQPSNATQTPPDPFRSERLRLLGEMDRNGPLRSELLKRLRAGRKADRPILKVVDQAREYQGRLAKIAKRVDNLRRAINVIKSALDIPPYSAAERRARVRELRPLDELWEALGDLEIDVIAATTNDLETVKVLAQYRCSLLAQQRARTQWGPNMVRAARDSVELANTRLGPRWRSLRRGYVGLLCVELDWFPQDETPDRAKLDSRLRRRLKNAPELTAGEIEELLQHTRRLATAGPAAPTVDQAFDRAVWKSQVRKRRRQSARGSST